MSFLHVDLVSLRRILLVVLAVASFLMIGPATNGGTSLAGVPSRDIKSARKTHVPIVVVLVGSFGVSPPPWPALLAGSTLLDVPVLLGLEAACQIRLCVCWFLVTSSLTSSSAPLEGPRTLECRRWSLLVSRGCTLGCGCWSWGYGRICCNCCGGIVCGGWCWGWYKLYE